MGEHPVHLSAVSQLNMDMTRYKISDAIQAAKADEKQSQETEGGEVSWQP